LVVRLDILKNINKLPFDWKNEMKKS
jgi:hypothetical protein